MCRSSVWRSLLPPPRPESDRDIRRSETFFSAVRSCPAATNLPPARSTKNAKPRDTRDRHRDREYREVGKSERETETARRKTEGKRQRQRETERERDKRETDNIPKTNRTPSGAPRGKVILRNQRPENVAAHSSARRKKKHVRKQPS